VEISVGQKMSRVMTVQDGNAGSTLGGVGAMRSDDEECQRRVADVLPSSPMDFVLRYRGPLAATGSVKEKHDIRRTLHPQLLELCNQEPLFKKATSSSAALPRGVLKGREVEVPRPLQELFFLVELGGFHFVPLISRPHELACSLDILFLRRGRPGAIVHGGDIDNRLKTLFDALRMPHDAGELRGVTPGAPDERTTPQMPREHGAARAGHPDVLLLDIGIQLTASPVLEVERVQVDQQSHDPAA